MPSINPNESEQKYISRCVKFVMEHENLSQKAALGKCYGMYKQHKKAKGNEEPEWDESGWETDFTLILP